MRLGLASLPLRLTRLILVLDISRVVLQKLHHQVPRLLYHLLVLEVLLRSEHAAMSRDLIRSFGIGPLHENLRFLKGISRDGAECAFGNEVSATPVPVLTETRAEIRNSDALELSKAFEPHLHLGRLHQGPDEFEMARHPGEALADALPTHVRGNLRNAVIDFLVVDLRPA